MLAFCCCGCWIGSREDLFGHMAKRLGDDLDHDSLQRYRRLVEDSDVGLFQTTTDGNILWVNDVAARIVGYASAEDFMSRVHDIGDIYVDPSRRDVFRREVAERGRVSGFEYEIYRKDRSIRWISVSARRLDVPPSTTGFEGVVTDVTDRKLLQAALEAVSSGLDPTEAIGRFATVLSRAVPFEQVTLAVVYGDRYRRMVSISASGDLARFPRDEMVALAGNSMETVVAEKRSVTVPDTSVGDYEFDSVLAERGVASYLILPLIDEGGEVFATFNVGAGRTQAFEGEVIALLESVAAVVANAVKNILMFERERDANVRLEELDRLRKELFSWVAHDLRAPLAVIKGNADILVQLWDAMDDPDKLDRLKIVVRQADRMGGLLKRNLELSLIEAGDLKVKTDVFDLAGLARQAVGDVAAANPDRVFVAEVEGAVPAAIGDPERTLEVVGNLLSNAVKFSPPNSRIEARVSGSDEDVEVTVHNEAPGIDEHSLEGVFDKLTRVDPTREGVGLGLYISKNLVDLQSGRIWATASEDGVTFGFAIPAAPAPSNVD